MKPFRRLLNEADSMLANIIAAQQEHLNALAHDWLAAGAVAFGIWDENERLAYWSTGNGTNGTSLTAKISVGSLDLGELRLTGLQSQEASRRLHAEAKLLSHLAHLERDLNSMAADLIDTRDQLLALYELTDATRHYVDLAETLQQLAREAARLVKAESSFLLLETPNEPRLCIHYPTMQLDEASLQACLTAMEQSDKPFLSTRDKVSEDPPYRSLLLVPMKIRQAKTAVLGVLNKMGDDFMSPDVKMAKAIADYASAQIENVLLFQASVEQTKLQTEMEMAQRVQIHLLPSKPPHVTGLDLWAATRPASHVGGDFYDFVVGAGHPFAFTIGDISGKGMPAALLMTMTRTVLRTKLNVVPMPNPAEVIARANQELYNDFTDVSMFATVFIGQYDPSSQMLSYANAGHSPVIYCPANGKAQLLEADGTAMGILSISFSQTHHLKLQPGDLFIAGTDGLNEASNQDDELFGIDRLLRLIESLAHKSAEEIAAQIYKQVQTFGTGDLQDDQTLLILKCIQ